MAKAKAPKTIHQKLLEIQQNLNVPKTRYNKFGNFYYRSCEDILEALKPHLKKHDLILNLFDEAKYIGTWNYIEARVVLTDDKGNQIFTTALAREPLEKKKMDEPQLTGTASSYARKYALNGLFMIDDTKDADTDEYKEQTKEEVKKTKSTKCLIHNVEMKRTKAKDGKFYNAHQLEDGTWCRGIKTPSEIKAELKGGK